MKSLFESDNPLSTTSFKTHLTTAAINLAILAEGVRPVERIFMTHAFNPGYLAKLYQQAGDFKQISFSEIPTKATHIYHLYDQSKNQWIQSEYNEEITKAKLEKRLHDLKQFLNHISQIKPTAYKIFLVRQQAFYASLVASSTPSSDKNKPSIDEKKSTAIDSIIPQLSKQFSMYTALICLSPENAANDVAKKLAKPPTDLVSLCEDIIFTLLIGRDIVGNLI